MFQPEVVEKIKSYILYSRAVFSKNRALCELMWNNIVEPDRPRRTIWNIRIAYWVHKAKNTHSVYVIFMTLRDNDGCTNAPNCYVMCTLSVLLSFRHHAFYI